MDRVRIALQMLKREQGAPEKKLPAGPKEIALAKEAAQAFDDPRDEAILDAVLNTGFSYMLREG